MKAVTAHPLFRHAPRKSEVCRLSWLGVVKGRVETGNLCHSRVQSRKRFDGRHVMGLMQRRQRDEPAQFRDDIGIDPNGSREASTAMHDPVPGRDDVAARELLLDPAQNHLQSLLVTRFGAQLPIDQNGAAGVLRDEMSSMSQTFALSFAKNVPTRRSTERSEE